VLVLVTLLSAAAAADPSYFGYSGLIKVPTAEALDDHGFNAAIFHIFFNDTATTEIYTGNLGVADGVEVGLAVIRRDSGGDDIFINGKYRFQSGSEGRPAFAVGAIDMIGEVESTVYFTATQSFGRVYETAIGPLHAGELHVGFGGGQLDGPFGGLSANVSPALKLMFEYDTEDFNLGARFRAGKQFRIDASLFDWTDVGFGVSYNYPY
jgi:hypothetical protein